MEISAGELGGAVGGELGGAVGGELGGTIWESSVKSGENFFPTTMNTVVILRTCAIIIEDDTVTISH